MITNQTRSGELSVAGGWRMGGWGVTFLIHSKSNCSLPSPLNKICFLLHQLISPGGGGGHLVTGSVITLHWQEERRRTIAQFTQSIELFVQSAPPPPTPARPAVFVNVIIWKLTPYQVQVSWPLSTTDRHTVCHWRELETRWLSVLMFTSSYRQSYLSQSRRHQACLFTYINLLLH